MTMSEHKFRNFNGVCIEGLHKDRGGISCGRPENDPIHGVDLFGLTVALGLPMSQQSAVLAWSGESIGHRWTSTEVEELRELWESDGKRIARESWEQANPVVIELVRLEAQRIENETLSGLVSGWVHEDGTACPEYLAPSDYRQWWCTTHQQRVSLPNTPAEQRTGISDRTAAALADVARLRENAAAMPEGSDQDDAWAALDRIEQALRERGR